MLVAYFLPILSVIYQFLIIGSSPNKSKTMQNSENSAEQTQVERLKAVIK